MKDEAVDPETTTSTTTRKATVSAAFQFQTSAGDTGVSNMGQGVKAPKNHPVNIAFGKIDSLMTSIGFVENAMKKYTLYESGKQMPYTVLSKEEHASIMDQLGYIRASLYNLNAALYNDFVARCRDTVSAKPPHVPETTINAVTEWQKVYENNLPKLTNFVRIHPTIDLLRTEAREAERAVIQYYTLYYDNENAPKTPHPNIALLNHLSKYAFHLGRFVNMREHKAARLPFVEEPYKNYDLETKVTAFVDPNFKLPDIHPED